MTSFQFTLKFRKDTGHWQWARDEYALGNEQVIFKPLKAPSSVLRDYLSDLNEGLEIQRIDRANSTCVCWEVYRRVPPADGHDSGWDIATLGAPTAVSRAFALVRHNPAWFAPRQGQGALMLDADAVLLSFLRNDGLHLVLVAVSGFDEITCVFRTDEQGHIVVASRNDAETVGTAHLFVAVGPTAHNAVEVAMDAAKDHVNRQTGKVEEDGAHAVSFSPEEEQELTNWYDGLTYCTWNGLGQDLTLVKILEALDVLNKSEIDISNLLIDDNWQSLDFAGVDNFYHQWTNFDANAEHFPGGLKELISTIRRSHPNIGEIAVWHGIFGYWGGMSLESQLSGKHAMRTFERQEGIFLGGGTLTTVDGSDAGRLYDNLYRYV